MSQNSDINSGIPGAQRASNAYGPDSDIADFILGITYEIWEQRQVDKILEYYKADVEVFSLEGITNSAAQMVKQTHETLAAFPNRLLLGDEVIACGSAHKGFSSHRITSPMTNEGATAFGPATRKRVQTMNIADCQISNGQITKEWLVRDNLSLVQQLGFDSLEAAQTMASSLDETVLAWHQNEIERIRSAPGNGSSITHSREDSTNELFARKVLEHCWITGNHEALEIDYAPYCVMQRSPVRIFSGRDQILEHYEDWRQVFPDACLSIDHVCSEQLNNRNQNIAVRWSIAGTHSAAFAGAQDTGKPIHIMGVTHWKVIDGRITAEWTVFDELAMLAQSV
jgi:predicted ester cyclase